MRVVCVCGVSRTPLQEAVVQVSSRATSVYDILRYEGGVCVFVCGLMCARMVSGWWWCVRVCCCCVVRCVCVCLSPAWVVRDSGLIALLLYCSCLVLVVFWCCVVIDTVQGFIEFNGNRSTMWCVVVCMCGCVFVGCACQRSLIHSAHPHVDCTSCNSSGGGRGV